MKTRKIVYLILILVIAVIVGITFSKSLFIIAPARLNIVVYGQDSRVYSIDTRGNTHYLIHFGADEKFGVPGGYGYYRVGALGKLVSLEKNPQLFGKAFSLASSSFVSYYFYPNNDNLYYGGGVKKDVILATPAEIFKYSSNANIFDRLYLFLHFIQAKRNDYLLLRSSGDSKLKNGARIFVPGNFSKETEGFMYNPTYRRERNTVQIIYSESYNSARDIGNILEGGGIRVVDIKQDSNSNSKCIVLEEGNSETGRDMARFFGCERKQGSNEVSDILFDIRGIEKAWTVQ